VTHLTPVFPRCGGRWRGNEVAALQHAACPSDDIHGQCPIDQPSPYRPAVGYCPAVASPVDHRRRVAIAAVHTVDRSIAAAFVLRTTAASTRASRESRILVISSLASDIVVDCLQRELTMTDVIHRTISDIRRTVNVVSSAVRPTPLALHFGHFMFAGSWAWNASRADIT